MKKNRMMRLASVLLICVLLTTSVISGTFAKYTTKGNASNTARVAKWGVSFDVQTDMFLMSYEKHDTSATLIGNYTVSSREKVVAPGTSGNILDFDIIHEEYPEVSYVVTFDVKEDSQDIFLKTGDDSYYYPMTYSINCTSQGYDFGVPAVTDDYSAIEHNKIEHLAAALENMQIFYDVTTGRYTVKYLEQDGVETVELPQGVKPEFELRWNWSFSRNSTIIDEYDTLLGNYAAQAPTDKTKGTDYETDFVFAYDIIATQVD